MPFVDFLHRVSNRENLTQGEAETAMQHILAGEATDVQIAGFLVALRMKGESADELVGFAKAMRAKSTRVTVPAGATLLDTCGTGGDGHGTFNISTVAAFIVAGAGVRVAKHGNRSLSSLCGSADILEELGVCVDIEPSQVGEIIKSVGIGFLFAPKIQPAMRFAQKARSELKLRTVFNLLGPLTNPAGATAQLVGAPSIRAAELMAKALASLDLPRGMVVHGFDGLDEISLSGETLVYEITRGAIGERTVTPKDFGFETAPLSAIKGGDRVQNASIARAILEGERGPRRDIAVMNAAAALVVAGRARSFEEGVELANKSLDRGAARGKLTELANASKF